MTSPGAQGDGAQPLLEALAAAADGDEVDADSAHRGRYPSAETPVRTEFGPTIASMTPISSVASSVSGRRCSRLSLQARPGDGALERVGFALQHEQVVLPKRHVRERAGTAGLVADDGRDLDLAVGEPVQIRHRLPDHIRFRRDARLGDVVLDVERRVEGGSALAPLRQQAIAEGEEDDAGERDADARPA